MYSIPAQCVSWGSGIDVGHDDVAMVMFTIDYNQIDQKSHIIGLYNMNFLL